MAKIKVVQCWDDGVLTDIRLTELCRKYGAKATFNLNPGLMGEERRPIRWIDEGKGIWTYNGFCAGKLSIKDIAEVYSGFEVASHCWKHENADSMPVEEWIKTAADARKFLEDLFQRECRGFAWPYGQHTPETERLLSEAGFRYGRTTANTADVTCCPQPLALASNCHFLNRNFWQIFEDAKKTGAFYFWGHSYEMMDCPQIWERFDLAIRLLSEDPEVEWVDVIDLVPLLH